jgi:hypothetical protein
MNYKKMIMLYSNEGYEVFRESELFETCLYTILTSICINHLHIWFVQIDLILNLFLWISLNFILKISHILLIKMHGAQKHTQDFLSLLKNIVKKKKTSNTLWKAFIKFILNLKINKISIIYYNNIMIWVWNYSG